MRKLQMIGFIELLNQPILVYGTLDKALFLKEDVKRCIKDAETSKVSKISLDKRPDHSFIQQNIEYPVSEILTEWNVYELLRSNACFETECAIHCVKQSLKDIRLYGLYSRNRTYINDLRNVLKQLEIHDCLIQCKQLTRTISSNYEE